MLTPSFSFKIIVFNQEFTLADTLTAASMTDGFAARKLEIADNLEQLVSLPMIQGNPRLKKAAATLHDKLRSYVFNLVILGEFKRGKSTLVNALLGANILPTGVIPLTSITTIIQFGETPEINVHFLNGQTERMNLSELEKYVTERGNPKNTLSVDQVEVHYPSPLLQHSVRIVDTPGTGSVNQHNTETTYQFLPEADAALFVLSADQPASINELKFLNDAKNLIDEFFFVQNKIDILTESERLEALEFLERSLTEQIGTKPTIYPISARRALNCKLDASTSTASTPDRDFQNLEEAIFGFLANEKSRTFTRSLNAKTRRLALEAKQLLELEIKTAQLPGETLKHGMEVFQQCTKNIVNQQNDVDHIVSGETKRLIKSIETDLYPLVEEHIEQIKQAINDEYSLHQSESKDRLIEALQSRLRSEIATAFATWRVTEEELVSKQLNDITARFATVANSIVEEINAVTEKLFGLEFQKTFEMESLTKKSSHYFAVDNPFTLSMQMMPLLLPGFLAKNIIKERFIENVREEMQRNAGRLRADMQERIEKSARAFLTEFKSETNAFMAEIAAVMERTMESKAKSEEQQMQLQQQLTEDLKTIDKVLENLKQNDAE